MNSDSFSILHSSFSRIKFGLTAVIAIILLNSCLVKRVVKPGEYLYSGAKAEFHSDTVIEEKGKLKSTLKGSFFPPSNSKTLGLPIKLWIYSIFYRSSHQGLWAFIADNYGEPPVYLSDVPLPEVTGDLESVLKANGFLDARVIAKEKKSGLFKRSRKIIYNSYLKPPYRIRNFTNNLNDTVINNLLEIKRKEIVKPGDRYNLADLQSERVQIDSILKSLGYFYFSPELIIFVADSTIGGRLIDISMRFRNDVDSDKLKPWFINDVFVQDIGDSLKAKDTVLYKNIHYLTLPTFKPKHLRQFLLFNKGEILTYENLNVSNKNLSSEDAFKFTNIETEPVPGGDNLLNIYVKLIPNKRNNIKAEFDLVSKSNDFTGPGITLSHLHRNLMGGAEELLIRAGANIEFLLTKRNQTYLGDINYELSSSVSLNFPRFLAFNPLFFSPRRVPNTQFMIEGRIMQQIRYYRMSFLRFIYGYKWSETSTKHHELNPADINLQHQIKSTFEFDSLVSINPLLQQSFADQFFIGSSYNFRYEPAKEDRSTVKTAFTGSFEAAGNLLYGIQNLTGEKKEANVPLEFLGTVYSQFIRTIADFRTYFKVNRSYTIALRMNTGIGVALGNSRILPIIRQFYLGGVDNLRAFQFRSVGPGAFAIDESSSRMFYNHTGDVLLLGSIENRIRIANHFEAALFLDAGNVWLLREDPLRPNGRFDPENFYKEIASGWGYGLRYISDFFIIRVDIGVPIYSPNPLQPASGSVFNLAIGYPF